ncbi:GAF domain-containing protein [Altererythrobacter sp. ZODW24]|uniref:adenylate/guanylate cyclase domain-containing protein n=1 Tax=Altererythrobacter sp. ZODW24 TaxID=2185142 RepID=UPI000DF72240|nr:GAF domain-containing protein [Altererythrobacter sp. ZODW24]
MLESPLFEYIGIAATILGLIALVVGLARWFFTLEANASKSRDETKQMRLQDDLSSAKARNEQLLESVRLSGEVGRVALSLKTDLDERLQRFMAATGATGGSIYVPIEGSNGAVAGLSFLTIEPFNRQNRLLKSKIIPLRSMAGRAFQQGEAVIVSHVADTTERFQGAESVSGYQPISSINLPLRLGDEVIGVLQLLRRRGEQPFGDEELGAAKLLVEEVAGSVGDLRKYPEIFGAMNGERMREGTDATVLFFDISSSSLLFREFPTSSALQMLNEFFEQICEVGFQHGGALDNYMGDGALMRFGGPRISEGHELNAANAACAMAKEFATVRHYWTELNPALGKVNFRAGIASGQLVEGAVGHSLVRNLSVAGLPISVASALCNAAPRDRSAIYVDGSLADRLGDQVELTPIALDAAGKLAANTDRAFELVGVR